MGDRHTDDTRDDDRAGAPGDRAGEPADRVGEPGDPRADVSGVIVTVTRSGGFAGLTRQWRAEPPAASTERWIAMIDRCPWDAAQSAPGPGADRLAWSIHACTPVADRSADLAETALTGPWRDLVDEVRSAASAREPSN